MAVNLASTQDINTFVQLARSTKNLTNPEVFYSKQLLDTIRYDANNYVYYRLADESPIQDKADKLTIRRWAPLQAHTEPLAEGMPPMSDKGSVEKYELQAAQYGRYMEFTDKVDFHVVDPVVAHYTKEYSLVAVETLDLLARETLFSIASKFFANGKTGFAALDVTCRPTITDLRLIALSLKKSLVKPRSNGRYHVIASPEFYFDMVSDPTVEKYMTINQTTKTMYDDSSLVPMFGLEFYETLLVPTSSKYKEGSADKMMLFRTTGEGQYEYKQITLSESANSATNLQVTKVSGYVKDSRTGQDASYIPNRVTYDLAAWNAAHKGGGNDWAEFKAQHILVVGKDALTRTGLQGEGQARMFVKQKGSAGVLDPIDQRQSIGFKINSVGFGSTRLEAVVDYVCVPSQVN